MTRIRAPARDAIAVAALVSNLPSWTSVKARSSKSATGRIRVGIKCCALAALEVRSPPLRRASWAEGEWPMQYPDAPAVPLQGCPSRRTAGQRWGFPPAALGRLCVVFSESITIDFSSWGLQPSCLVPCNESRLGWRQNQLDGESTDTASLWAIVTLLYSPGGHSHVSRFHIGERGRRMSRFHIVPIDGSHNMSRFYIATP